MLCIFDLDDTLIETSKEITTQVFKNLLDCFGASPIDPTQENRIFQALCRLNQGAKSSRGCLAEYLEIHQVEESLAKQILLRYESAGFEDISIQVDQSLICMLEEFSKKHTLAIVTRGKKGWQEAKLKKSRLPLTLFHKILITSEEGKRPHYQALMQELDYQGHEVVVIGDRIGVDLAPAKQLGCVTILFENVRNNSQIDLGGQVDYTIAQMEELYGVFDRIERNNFVRCL
ncbi:MAG: hypothetical protein S4CHLAM102_08000 [Chlamydiia bacterium]|nr:hypothetical protein [Chlamydiia bacterium]